MIVSITPAIELHNIAAYQLLSERNKASNIKANAYTLADLFVSYPNAAP